MNLKLLEEFSVNSKGCKILINDTYNAPVYVLVAINLETSDVTNRLMLDKIEFDAFLSTDPVLSCIFKKYGRNEGFRWLEMQLNKMAGNRIYKKDLPRPPN